jgi:sugar/nucleoside kinase (ribokinase family)
MKFLVVGHLCLDVIHPIDGPEVESYGGIYYSLGTLGALLDKSDKVVPVFGVNRDDYQALMDHLSQFPNVDTSGIFKFDEPTNRVHLYYRDFQARTECSSDIAKPIPFEKIRPHLSVDGILVNMISGSDIEIQTLDLMRMAVRSENTSVHFDYHSLTLAINEKRERFRRPVQDWRRWAFMIDTVQLNEEELAGLAVEQLTEQQTVGHLLTLSMKGVVVTRGERGTSLFYNEHKHVVRKDIAGINVGSAQDTTGCGDVFGAAFFYHYVRTRDMLASAEFANRIAASKVHRVGSSHLGDLMKSPITA